MSLNPVNVNTAQSQSGAVAAARRYVRLMLDAVYSRKADATAVVGLGLLGALAQAGAIGALLSFLHVMGSSESGSSVQWTWFTIEPGVSGLIYISSVLAGMLVLATGASYLSARRARAIGRACTERCVERLIRTVAQMPTGSMRADMESPRTIAVRGSRLMGLSAETALKLFHPIVQIVVLAGALVYIDAWATLWLMPALLLPLPILWKFNKSVRRSARLFYESAASGFGRAVSAAIDTVDQTNVRSPALCDAAIRQYRANPAVGDFFQAYDDMSLTADRAVLITSSFRPVVLGYVLVVLGTRAFNGSMDWAQMIAYMVVLVQVLGRAEGVIATFSVLNRLYTQVAAYMNFIESATSREPVLAAEMRSHSIIIESGGGRVEIMPGAPVQVFTGRPLTRLTAGEVIECLVASSLSGQDSLRSIAFVGRRYRPRGDVYGTLAAGEAGQDSWVIEQAERLGCAESVRAVIDRLVDDDLWQELDDRARVLLQIGPMLRFGPSLIAIDIALLTALERSDSDRLLRLLADQALLVIAPDYRSGLPWASGAIVMEDGVVVGAGSREWWLRSELRERLASSKRVQAQHEEPTEIESELL